VQQKHTQKKVRRDLLVQRKQPVRQRGDEREGDQREGDEGEGEESEGDQREGDQRGKHESEISEHRLLKDLNQEGESDL